MIYFLFIQYSKEFFSKRRHSFLITYQTLKNYFNAFIRHHNDAIEKAVLTIVLDAPKLCHENITLKYSQFSFHNLYFIIIATQDASKMSGNPSMPFVPTFSPSNASNQFLTGPMIPSSNTPAQVFNPNMLPLAQPSKLIGVTPYTPSVLPSSQQAPREVSMFTPSNINTASKTPTNFYAPTQATSLPQASQVYQPGYPPASNSPTEYNISPFASMNSQNNASYIAPSTPKVTPHWFYLRTWTIQLPFYKVMMEWVPFSRIDSHNLEHEFLLHRGKNNSLTIQTDGGRYDVNLDCMSRQAIYWKEEPSTVRRCTWFYKEENQFVPYEGEISEKLEVGEITWHKT